jgi:uncharacterized membrane protein
MVFSGGTMTQQPFLVPAALIILVSIPLVFGIIPRNRFYGIRTAKTLSDDGAWRKSNRFGAWALIFSCLSYLLVAKLFPTGQNADDFSLWLLHLAVFLLSLFASLMLTIRYIRKL